MVEDNTQILLLERVSGFQPLTKSCDWLAAVIALLQISLWPLSSTIKQTHCPARDRQVSPCELNNTTLPALWAPKSTNTSTLLCIASQDKFYQCTPTLQNGLPALVMPLNNPIWNNFVQYLQSNPGVYYFGHTANNDFFKVIWDTDASEVITSNTTNFIGGYNKPSLPLQLHVVSLGTMVSGIDLVKFCLCADNHSNVTIQMKAYYMPGYSPTNIKWLPPKCACLVSGGDFITIGTSETLCLPHKPFLTMTLDPSSHLPCCTATRSSMILAQGQNIIYVVWLHPTKTWQSLKASSDLALSFGHLNFTTAPWLLCSGIIG